MYDPSPCSARRPLPLGRWGSSPSAVPARWGTLRGPWEEKTPTEGREGGDNVSPTFQNQAVDQQQMNDEHALQPGMEKPHLDGGESSACCHRVRTPFSHLSLRLPSLSFSYKLCLPTGTELKTAVVISNDYEHLPPRGSLPNYTPSMDPVPPAKTATHLPQDTLTHNDFEEMFKTSKNEQRASNLTTSSYGSQAPLIPPSPNGPRSTGGNGAGRPPLDSDQPFNGTAVYATVTDRGLSDSTSSQAPLINERAGSQERLLDRSSNTGGGKWYQGDPSMPPRHNSVSKV